MNREQNGRRDVGEKSQGQMVDEDKKRKGWLKMDGGARTEKEVCHHDCTLHGIWVS